MKQRSSEMKQRSSEMNKMTVIAAITAIATVAPAAYISDDFNRPDGTDLGQTAEGISWVQYAYGGNDITLLNGAMNIHDSFNALYADGVPKIGNFVADMDISRPSETWGSTSYFIVNFRMGWKQELIAGGGTDNGYQLRYFSDDANELLWAELYDDKGHHPGATGAEEYTLASSSGSPISVANADAAQHLTVSAIGSVISVALNGSEVINYDATGDNNPAATGEGYISFQAASNRDFSMDNLQVIPEPATFGLLCISSLGLLFARKVLLL